MDKLYDIDKHKQIMTKLYDGQLSLSDYKDAFYALIRDKENVISNLKPLTKNQLLPMLSSIGQYRYKNDKKEQIVKEVYNDFVSSYALTSIIYEPFSETYEAAVTKQVEKNTQEDLDNFAKEVAKAREERKAKLEKMAKAIKNPETLDDFKLFIKINGADKLTPEQKIKYDELVSETIKEKRQQEQEQKATIKAVDLGETKMELKETIHTRDKYPLFVVTLSDRVSKEQYQELNSKAKQLGGWYSSFRGQGAIPGFQFKQKEQAEKFMGLKESDISNIDKVEERQEIKTEKKVSKLRENANKMIEDADKELNRERLTNTAKRAREAGYADEKAREKKRIAQTMINIADAIENGNVKLLDGVNARTHVELLDNMIRNARRYEIDERYKDLSYNDRESKKLEPATIETIDYLKYGFYPSFYIPNLKELVYRALNINGVKRIAGKWDNKLKSLSDDRNYQITNGDQMSEIIEMFNAIPEKETKYWTIGSLISEYKRLKSMGIENDSMLRAALREYIQFRGKTQKTDKVKELERNLAGRKNIGIDFFPTPKSEAQNMVEIANISKGMDVLEPSAGNGNIAEAIKEKGVNPDVIEISSALREILEAKGFNLVGNDFMDYTGKKYDRIIMNPPFGHGAESLDIDHVKHAYSLLKPGGRIVSIMGAGTFFRNDKKAVEFREWLDNVGYYEELPENTFADKTLLSTTNVKAYRVIIDNNEPEQPQSGLSNNLTLSDIAKKHNVSIESLKEQLEKGKKVELEHTNDIEKAEKIAMDHLVEMPDYYTKLQEMEQQNPVETYGHTSPSETDKIQSEIEGLAILLDLADTNTEKEKIQSEIEGLQILLDIENI